MFLDFLYRRMKVVVVSTAALFLGSLFLATLTDVLATAMPVISFGLLFALLFAIAMSLIVGEEIDANVEGDFTHHDELPQYLADDEDASSRN